MARPIFLFLFVFQTLVVFGQDHCIFYGRFIETGLYPEDEGTFNNESHLHFYADSIVINNHAFTIDQLTKTPFNTKDDLLRNFGCIYDFYSYSEHIEGEVLEYNLKERHPDFGNTLTFIHFNDGGNHRFFVFTESGMYKFYNIPIFDEEEVMTITQTPIRSHRKEFITELDTSGQITIISEPIFEEVQELVLVKSASQRIEVTPSEFITSHHIVMQESSTCENAIFDTTTTQLILKETHDSLLISPAIFETVTEQILAREAFEGAMSFDREVLDSLVVPLRTQYNEFSIIGIHPDCKTFQFYSCLDLEYIEIPAVDTTFFDIYPTCPPGFQSAVISCYTADGVVPAAYTTRLYERLILPPTVEAVELPHVSSLWPIYRVSNRDQLDTGCIEVTYDTIPYQKLVIPAFSRFIDVPAEYETRTYQRYLDGGEIEVITPGIPEIKFEIETTSGGSYHPITISLRTAQNVLPCYYSAVAKRLFEVGYLSMPEFEDAQTFYSAVIDYQSDHNLPLGVMDASFIQKLQVQFGY